jgi:hypothetical protein
MPERFSRKTKLKKGEKMKRLVLLSVAAMMFASAVFAPVAMAQEPGDVEIQSITVGPGGSLHIEGTIVCEEGARYFIGVDARQTQGNQPVKSGSGSTSEDVCQSTGLETFTIDVLPDPGSRPFRKGEVTLDIFRSYCGPSLCDFQSSLEVFEVTRAR